MANRRSRVMFSGPKPVRILPLTRDQIHRTGGAKGDLSFGDGLVRLGVDLIAEVLGIGLF